MKIESAPPETMMKPRICPTGSSKKRKKGLVDVERMRLLASAS
jgi:hypothetical protein